MYHRSDAEKLSIDARYSIQSGGRDKRKDRDFRVYLCGKIVIRSMHREC
jgi:hypothetical protein